MWLLSFSVGAASVSASRASLWRGASTAECPWSKRASRACSGTPVRTNSPSCHRPSQREPAYPVPSRSRSSTPPSRPRTPGPSATRECESTSYSSTCPAEAPTSPRTSAPIESHRYDLTVLSLYYFAGRSRRPQHLGHRPLVRSREPGVRRHGTLPQRRVPHQAPRLAGQGPRRPHLPPRALRLTTFHKKEATTMRITFIII